MIEGRKMPEFQRRSKNLRTSLVRSGRSRGAIPKRPVTIRLDTDVIAHFQAAGRGWQTRINAALRQIIGKP